MGRKLGENLEAVFGSEPLNFTSYKEVYGNEFACPYVPKDGVATYQRAQLDFRHALVLDAQRTFIQLHYSGDKQAYGGDSGLLSAASNNKNLDARMLTTAIMVELVTKTKPRIPSPRYFRAAVLEEVLI
eukprot:5530389-Pyramimonas_sp.AAC.1